MAFPCAVPGINLSDYRTLLPRPGWGSPCSGERAAVVLNDEGARVSVDVRIAELVGLIMRANEAQGYHYRPADTGAYNCRKISGSSQWSLHAWALAIDENWQTNPYTYPLRTDKPEWLVRRWNRYGFAWGGHYSGSADAMHFEAMGTPAQMQDGLMLARAELGGIVPGPAPTPAPPPDPSGQWHDVSLGGVSDLWGRGEQVGKDQFDLNDTGFPCQVDGFWGPGSVTAAKAFQFAARITVDGEFGPQSRTAIHKVPSWRSAGPRVLDDPGGYSARQWQQKLRDHGWRIAVDNAWGAHSKSILRQFQADKGIVADGLRGPQSWTCLYCTVN